MKLRIKKDADKPYGVELIASSFQDKEILRRFWEGGVKVNSMTNDYKIEFTFADLIEQPIDSQKSEQKACWSEFKDIMDGVDHVVAPERLAGIQLACITDLKERLDKIEEKLGKMFFP